jgi:hypothetical protein
VWVHPFLDATRRVVLQYWYFYPFNDYMSDHEGDWEHVNVVLNEDRASIREIDYYFHGRSVRLPQGRYLPEIQDGTHPVVYVGGRAYMVSDYPMRLINGDHNSGSHGNYPYPGEWEAAAALGHTESVAGRGGDAGRTVTHDEFRTVVVPEASRIDYRAHPEVLRDWAPLLLPVRWGFPSGPSLASVIKLTDVGNRAPFGPAFNAGWNRTAPGLAYPNYRVRRILYLSPSAIRERHPRLARASGAATPRACAPKRLGRARDRLAYSRTSCRIPARGFRGSI